MKVRSTLVYCVAALALLAACTSDTTPLTPSELATASRGAGFTAPTKATTGSIVQSTEPTSESHMGTSALVVAPKRPSVTPTPSQMRVAVGKLQALHISGMPSFALTLAAMDAMEMEDPDARHAAITALPVTIARNGAGTDSYGRALVSLRVTVNGKAVITRLVAVGVPAQAGETKGETESPFVGGPNAEEAGSSAFDCGGDPCATQQDRDDALATLAVLQTELDSVAAATNTAFGNCLADEVCAGWNDQDANGLGALASDNGVTWSGGPRLWTSGSFECQPTSATIAGGEYFGCGWKILEAAGGIAWAVAEVAADVALAASPDPVSKWMLLSRISGTVAGVTAAVYTVHEAYVCIQQ